MASLLRFAVLALLGGLLAPPDARAEDGEEVLRREAPTVLARMLLEGRRAGEGDIAARCAAAAAEAEIDPWEVADEALGLGDAAAALAFALAATSSDREALAAYVQTPAARPPQVAARRALQAGLAALDEGLPSTVELEIGSDEAEPGTVLRVRQDLCRARAHRARSAWQDAATWNERAADAAERLGWRAATVEGLDAGARIALEELHDAVRARDALRRAVAVAKETGDPRVHGAALANLAAAMATLGDLVPACDAYREAVGILGKADEPILLADVWSNLGVALYRLGRYAPALDAEDRAWAVTESLLDTPVRRRPQAWIQVWYAAIEQEIGAQDRALGHLDRAAALLEGLSESLEPRELARLGGFVHGNRAFVLLQLGRHEEAERASLEALRFFERCRDTQGLVTAYANAARIRAESGDVGRALAQQRAAWEALTRAEDPVVALGIQTELAEVDLAAGLPWAAETVHESVLVQATELGLPYLCARQWTGLVASRVARGDSLGGTLAARRLLDSLGGVVGGLGDEEAAAARQRFADALQAGVVAAHRIGDLSSMCLLAEAGRSGALLEALGGRERLRDVVLPVEERAALVRTREAAQAAYAAYLSALASRDRKAVVARKAAHLEAQLAVSRQVARMQRQGKARVGLVYPTPDDLPRLAAHLRDGDALVLYVLADARAGGHALAIVIEPGSARVVDLGRANDVAEVTGRLVTGPDAAYSDDAADEVARRVVAPLALGPSVRRVIVSPDGELAYLPFARLLPDRVVALVPSGTTLGAVRADRAQRGPLPPGRPVLGVGDPDYGVMAGGIERERLPWSERLSRLPQTAVEVRRVAQVVLLGKDATEGRLLEEASRLSAEGGLRALHLAAHGRVDFDRPILSHVALTADGQDDGYLSVVEAMRLSLRTDLVVLSACQSGRGGHVRGEGVFGLVRAFMVAGAPAVIASLWKVDDRATRILMEDFYRRWTPGTSPAQALHDAQKALREAGAPAKDWAAWVLWGLPD